MAATWPQRFETAVEEQYQVEALVGEGGSGAVFKVTNPDGEPFAVKCLDPDRVTRDKRKRFRNELRFCQEHRHKNVVRVLDHGITHVKGRSCPFYVMPYYPATLRHLMKQGMPHNKVLAYFSQILDGVEAAHLLAVWHRDLKPENLLYSPDSDTLVVADFGIAHFTEDYLHTLVETKPHDRLANFQYAAPEQRAKGQSVDQRADIYALGLMVNEMFTGSIIQGAGYTRISDLVPDFGYLDDLVDSMVQQSPDERPSSIDDIKQQLIARKIEFVSRQKLDGLRQLAIPRYAIDDPLIHDPVTLVDREYRDGKLFFTLSQPVSRAWIDCFKTAHTRHGVPWGYGPERFSFSKNVASIGSPSEGQVQSLIDCFKDWVKGANREYERRVVAEKRRQEQEEKRELEEEIREEEKRQRILRDTRI